MENSINLYNKREYIMKKQLCCLMIVIFLITMPTVTKANSSNIRSPVVIAYGLDYEYDGQFDTLYNKSKTSDPYISVGRIRNSYYHNCDRRGWLEFNIKTIPNARYIDQVSLKLGWFSGSTKTPSTSLYGYTGNGSFNTEDIYQTNHLIASGLSSLYSVDVTSFVKDLVSNSKSYAGFLLVETKDDTNRNYGYFALDIHSVPEPYTMSLLLLGTLVAVQRIKK